jgi:hypothetical protein
MTSALDEMSGVGVFVFLAVWQIFLRKVLELPGFRQPHTRVYRAAMWKFCEFEIFY